MPSPDSELFRWFAEEVQPHEAALRTWLHGRFPDLKDVDDVVQD
ncbi:MAG: RNA polymerase subunit sigma-24, partial [Verrucomicrobia bacterium]|nr:RNA polymerase subunit sigma-24 [Verrucomicrobiota bacterium]